MTLLAGKLGAALLGAALLTGCDEFAPSGALSLIETSARDATRLVASADLARGMIVVSGPDGYCIDPDTLRRSGAGGFAAIASCNILSGGTRGPIVEPVLVTVAVSRTDTDAPDPADLAAALQTDLLQRLDLSAVVVGQMASGGETAFAGSDPRHWRGAFVLGAYLVGVTLYAPEGSPLLGRQGAAFLNTVSSRIRAKSPSVASESAEQSQSSIDLLEARLGRLFESSDL